MGILEDEIIKMLEIADNDLCYCGSGETFAQCCKKSSHPTWILQEWFDNNQDIFEKSQGVFSANAFSKSFHSMTTKCLLCGNDAIRSHTVSNNWMRKIFPTDFVCIPYPTDKGGLVMKKTPINVVSTFFGRCAEHDNTLFQPIDDGLDIKNNYHKNLLAYRSAGREFRMKQDAVKMMYSMFFLWGNKEKNSSILEKLILFYQGMVDQYKVMKYIWNGISSMKQSWSGLQHTVIELGLIEPLFSSSCISPAENNENIIYLTIYTNSTNQGYCMLSYSYFHKKSESFCKKLKRRIKKSETIEEINKVISQHCENIVCTIDRHNEGIETAESLTITNLYAPKNYHFIKSKL